MSIIYMTWKQGHKYGGGGDSSVQNGFARAVRDINMRRVRYQQ